MGLKEPSFTWFVYDNPSVVTGASDPALVGADHIVLEFTGSQPAVLKYRYLHGPVVDQVFAREDVESLWQPGEVLWALGDHLGTVRDLIDSAGNVVNHLRYEAFGRITSETNAAVDFLFAYTGREREEESGLFYYRARYYDPAVGRFISEDPLGFAAGDGNLARYVGNYVLSVTDPSGLQERRNGRFVGPPSAWGYYSGWNREVGPDLDRSFGFIVDPIEPKYSPPVDIVPSPVPKDFPPLPRERSSRRQRDWIDKRGCIGLCQWRLGLVPDSSLISSNPIGKIPIPFMAPGVVLFTSPVDAKDYAQIVFQNGGNPRYFIFQSTVPWGYFGTPPRYTPSTRFRSEVDPKYVALYMGKAFNFVTVHWDFSTRKWRYEWMEGGSMTPGAQRRFTDKLPQLSPPGSVPGLVVIGVIDVSKQEGHPFSPPEAPWWH
ncbi:MAG: hypothetical protein KatS3mg110_0028 [Pirellulaceae bacterium]|nr:MAG: hypothetical protein KatS3mg110_0028 [Pirellulaceae bacterium]